MFRIPLDTKQVISMTFPKPNSWLGIQKLNLTQQKHTFTHAPIKRNVRKTKGLVISHDIRPANGENLFWFWRFINLSLTYLLRHLSTCLQPQDLHAQTRLSRPFALCRHIAGWTQAC